MASIYSYDEAKYDDAQGCAANAQSYAERITEKINEINSSDILSKFNGTNDLIITGNLGLNTSSDISTKLVSGMSEIRWALDEMIAYDNLLAGQISERDFYAFYQKDKQWEINLIGKMASSGCGMCALASCFSTMGTYITPSQMVDVIRKAFNQNEYYFTTSTGMVDEAAISLGYGYCGGIHVKNEAAVREILQNGGTFVMLGDNGGHYLSLIGYNEATGKYIMGDSNDEDGLIKEVDYKTATSGVTSIYAVGTCDMGSIAVKNGEDANSIKYIPATDTSSSATTNKTQIYISYETKENAANAKEILNKNQFTATNSVPDTTDSSNETSNTSNKSSGTTTGVGNVTTNIGTTTSGVATTENTTSTTASSGPSKHSTSSYFSKVKTEEESTNTGSQTTTSTGSSNNTGYTYNSGSSTSSSTGSSSGTSSYSGTSSSSGSSSYSGTSSVSSSSNSNVSTKENSSKVVNLNDGNTTFSTGATILSSNTRTTTSSTTSTSTSTPSGSTKDVVNNYYYGSSNNTSSEKESVITTSNIESSTNATIIDDVVNDSTEIISDVVLEELSNTPVNTNIPVEIHPTANPNVTTTVSKKKSGLISLLGGILGVGALGAGVKVVHDKNKKGKNENED